MLSGREVSTRTAQTATNALPQSIGTTPLDFARTFNQSPIVSSKAHDWQHVSLHRFQVPSAEIKLGASCVHRVTLGLAGATLIERTRDGRRDRRWSEQGYSSLVPAGVPTNRLFKGPCDFMAAYLGPTLINEVAAEAFDLDPARAELVESLAVSDKMLDRFGLMLLAEAETGGTGTRLFADTLARALALYLLRAYSAQAPRAPAPPGALVGWRLRRAVEHMHVHLAENLPLAQLAATAGLSPSHFARAFRAATGEPPHRYLIRLRVEKARHLLEQTRLPVVEVGLRCGFEQTTHFATMFRKVTGLSPRAYRAVRCT